jgi:hypothetical protein
MSVRVTLILLCMFVSAACSAPKLDGSSDEKFKASTARVRESLPEARRTEFDTAFTALAFKNFSLTKAATMGVDAMTSDVRTAMNGKTADDVIAEFKKLEAERAEKAREEAMQEIAELKKERDSDITAKAELDKFTVERARFSVDRSGFMAEPRIGLRVRNGTAHAISRAHFRGRIVSPGRSVPWLEEDFNYQIPGGLEPGDVGDWNLSPNAFSKWGSVQAPANSGLEVTVMQLDGADGKKLFSAREFTPEDQARLAALEKQHSAPPK